MYVLEFEVSGVADFPFDMLRYDECFPARSEDVSKMCGRDKRRSVTLRTYTTDRRQMPTDGRWKSFGWRVTKCECRRVA